MNSSKPSILVVDDEPEIRKMIEVTLTAGDFRIVEAESGKEAVYLAGANKPDVILLDLELPDMDGKQVIERLREWSDVPIVVVSARTDPSEIVEAFELGADDYVTKPFNLDILMARLRKAMKHTYQKEIGESTLKIGKIVMDMIRHEVSVADEVLQLSPKEYELLSYMMRNEGRMLTHRQILKEVWGDAHVDDKQYLRVYIMQLRNKIEDDPEEPMYIRTEIGIGYRFEAPQKEDTD